MLSPINTGFAQDGVPDGRLVEFHRRRAGPGIGVAFVGNVATDMSVRSNSGTAVLASKKDVSIFSKVSQAIKMRGSLAGIQLGDMPIWLSPSHHWRADNLDHEVQRLRCQIENESLDRLKCVLERFEHSARLAAMAQFDVIEIHAAHGYMISLLLDPLLNSRQDDFGHNGPWFEDLVSRVRAASGPNVLLAVRISGYTGVRSPDEDEVRTTLMGRRLQQLGVDLIDLSAGYYTIDRSFIYPKIGSRQPNLELGTMLAHNTMIPVIISGNLQDLDVLKKLPRNAMIGLGRSLLADPDYVSKWLEDRKSSIVHCCSTGRCHFGSRGKASIACGKNDRLETDGG